MAGRDLVVVGGGIVGTSLALHAARAGLDTVLVDRRDPGRATDAGAGIVSPETDLGDDPGLTDFGCAASDAYDELVAELPSATAFERCGLIVAARGEAEARILDRLA
ncbi:MAG: FAD-dependent oxidoreductase, partial [Thermoanaerobaculia bacterium]|nr:FAD-dependent oxidoreductase [Thermoanaerobaculia bacterium]